MVLKERNAKEHPESGNVVDAGAEAERQMAFYLRRAFGNDPVVGVINDLRLLLAGGDAIQIDHLLLHPFGFVVIESKSITGTVLINEHGEWCRLNGQRRAGMRSPVQQARMQADGLRSVISTWPGTGERNSPGLTHTAFDILVAISDKSIIERQIPVPEVYKADTIPSRAQELIAGHRASQKLVHNDAARKDLAEFLLARHTPLISGITGRKARASKPTVSPSFTASQVRDLAAKPRDMIPPNPRSLTSQSQSLPSPKCRFCGSGALHAQYGKFGYYFRCIACTKNTPIEFACPVCSAKARVRKDGLNFFKDCAACGSVRLFYVNASLADLEDVDGIQ